MEKESLKIIAEAIENLCAELETVDNKPRLEQICAAVNKLLRAIDYICDMPRKESKLACGAMVAHGVIDANHKARLREADILNAEIIL